VKTGGFRSWKKVLEDFFHGLIAFCGSMRLLSAERSILRFLAGEHTRDDRSMSADFDLPRSPNAAGGSLLWDVVFPLVVVAIPPGVFRLMELVTRGFDGPGKRLPGTVLALMLGLQLLGMVAMAFVFLMRYDTARGRLSALTHRQPPLWRRLALQLSLGCLLLTDVLTNSAAAFRADFLFVAAVSPFFGYLGCRTIAFAGLAQTRPEATTPPESGMPTE
jgi:hypothetical protein